MGQLREGNRGYEKAQLGGFFWPCGLVYREARRVPVCRGQLRFESHMPDQLPAANALTPDTEVDVARGATAHRLDTREQLSVEDEPDQRLDREECGRERLAAQVP